MNLRTLKYFVAIADSGSFTAAATALAIAQPALTRRIRELEQDLGIQLLHRTPRGVRLTQHGAALYNSAQRLLAEADRVKAQLTGRDQGIQHVALGTSPTLSRILVPGVFGRFQHSLGDARLTVREAFTPGLLSWLEKGIIDLAVITNTQTDIAQPFTMRPLLAEPFALVTQASAGLPASVTARELVRVPLLITSLHRTLVERELDQRGLKLNVYAEIDSVDAIRELVLRGDGNTLIPVSVFKHRRTPEKLRLSAISDISLGRQLLLASRIERQQNLSLTLLQDIVTDELALLARQGIFRHDAPPG